MNEDVQRYVSFWSRKKADLQREIACKKRSLEQVEEKLSDPEFHLAKEMKRGAVKVSKALGKEIIKKQKVILKKNSEEEKTSLPIPETNVPVPAPKKEETNSSGTFF